MAELLNPKELIESIATALVEKADKVQVNAIEGEKSLIFELTVDNEDLGRVIGSSGHIVKAMRTILNAYSRRDGKRIQLNILEPKRAEN